MNIATKANVRTTQAARTSLKKGLQVSFNGGTVMGLGVAGLAVLGLSSLFIVFYHMYVKGAPANGEMMTALEVLAGSAWAPRASRSSPVGRRHLHRPPMWAPTQGGGRHPRGRSAQSGHRGRQRGRQRGRRGRHGCRPLRQLRGHHPEHHGAGREVVSQDDFGGMAPILLPIPIAGLGILFSIVGTFVRINKDTDSVMAALEPGQHRQHPALTAVASFS